MKKKSKIISAIARVAAAFTLLIATSAITPRCFVYLYQPNEPPDLKERLNSLKNKQPH